LTVEVLASLYAGYRNPEDRVTASQLSAIINGLATILRFALIDPQRSVMTDDVIEGRVTVRPSDVPSCGYPSTGSLGHCWRSSYSSPRLWPLRGS
jgi:hypothetical protein